MSDSLFANRPLRRGRLAVMALASVIVHVSLVGIAAIWPAPKSRPLFDPVTEMNLDDHLGEEVQKLIVAEDVPTPPPDMPTPPPEETPPEETPPPAEDPEMEEPELKPTPPPKPKVARAAATPAPANAQRGKVPQPGVVNGNVLHSSNTTGTPGGAKIGSGGFKTPQPNYPYQAKAARVTGSGSVRISTDGSGRVISAVMVSSIGNGILDSNTVAYAKANWHGPPNSTTTVPITYRLQ